MTNCRTILCKCVKIGFTKRKKVWKKKEMIKLNTQNKYKILESNSLCVYDKISNNYATQTHMFYSSLNYCSFL